MDFNKMTDTSPGLAVTQFDLFDPSEAQKL